MLEYCEKSECTQIDIIFIVEIVIILFTMILYYADVKQNLKSNFSANDRQFEVYDVIWEMKYYWLQYICSLQKNHSNLYLTRNMTRWNWNIILRDGKIDWISFHSSGYLFHLWAFQIQINFILKSLTGFIWFLFFKKTRTRCPIGKL